jgi:hypothetical protein
MKSFRKYNTEFRKNLKDKIIKLNNKIDYLYIYKLINEELESKVSVNRNGVYFNLNSISDECIEKIILFLDNKTETDIQIDHVKIEYKLYSQDNISNDFYKSKFTNQEKTILKKLHQK